MISALDKMSERELRLAMFGIGAVITTLIVVTLLLPQAKALAAARKTVDTLAAAAVNGPALEELLRQEDVVIADLARRMHGDTANLPVNQVEAFVIGRLQSVSWGNEVELVGVEPAVGDRVQSFQETLFRIRLIGRYKDLYRWLWDVRNELGFSVIKEFRLVRNEEEDTDPLLAADLSLASYRAVE